jgi:hypothetical protein
LNREVPNLPATVYFEDMQWQALLVYASKNLKPPADPPTLYEAMRLLSRMGGHLDASWMPNRAPRRYGTGYNAWMT